MPYVFPQECGGRADVHWLALTPACTDCCPQQQQQQEEEEGAPAVLLIAALPANSSSSTLQMNISRYSWQALHAAKHQHELLPDPQGLHLHLDCAHMGVGGDDSWSPSVHEQYLLPPGRYRLGLVMQAVGQGVEGVGLYAAAQQLQADKGSSSGRGKGS